MSVGFTETSLFLNDTLQSTRRLTDMSTDVTSKDQTTSTSRPVIIQSGSTPKKGSKPAAPQVSTKGLSFSYSVQVRYGLKVMLQHAASVKQRGHGMVAVRRAHVCH
jgi:hypothetical protein